MELRHLNSFLAVAENLSFIRASQKLHLSQPALSSQIQNLEQDLGVQLFTRNRRAVRLTEAGMVFVEEARATLARLSKAVERTQKAAQGEIGKLSIGFVSSAALEIVPSLVLAFRKKHPEVDLHLLNLRTSTQLESLAAQTIDVGFFRLPAESLYLTITTVHREPFVIALAKNHPLAGRIKVTLKDLRNESFVVYGRQWAPGFFDSIIVMCRANGFSPNIVQETGEMYTAIALVAAGAGVAVLPKSVVLAQSRNVVFRTLPPAAGVSEIAMASRKGETSPLVQSFIHLALQMRKTHVRL